MEESLVAEETSAKLKDSLLRKEEEITAGLSSQIKEIKQKNEKIEKAMKKIESSQKERAGNSLSRNPLLLFSPSFLIACYVCFAD